MGQFSTASVTDLIKVMDKDGPIPAAIARRIAAILRETEEFEWKDDGPTLEEAGGHLILVRYNNGAVLFPAERINDAWQDLQDGQPVNLESLATGWRRMPKV